MTACDQPLAALLDAEPDELAGRADSDLAEHIRDCSHCSEAARRILMAYGNLDEALAEAPLVDAESLVERAASGSATPTRGMRKWWLPTWTPVPIVAGGALATGLALALAFLFRSGNHGELLGEEWVPMDEDRPLLVAAPGHNVAVIPTANPDITIFWLYRENDDGQETHPTRDVPIGLGPGNGL